MIPYIPYRNVSITNIFPTVQAPRGVSYYIPILTLPYPTDDRDNWNQVLAEYYKAPGLWKDLPECFNNLKSLTKAEQYQLLSLGYNIIYNYPGGPKTILGIVVNGISLPLPVFQGIASVFCEIIKKLRKLLPFLNTPDAIQRITQVAYQQIINYEEYGMFNFIVRNDKFGVHIQIVPVAYYPFKWAEEVKFSILLKDNCIEIDIPKESHELFYLLDEVFHLPKFDYVTSSI